MMVKSLQAKLTKAASLQITPHIALVSINSVVMAPLLFKFIICLATIDSKAMYKVLDKPDSYMTTCGSDINTFYLYYYTSHNWLEEENMLITHSHYFEMVTRCAPAVLSGSTWKPRKKIFS